MLQEVKRCDDCHWWGTNHLGHDVCRFPENVTSGHSGDANLSLFTEEGRAWLITGPAFYCKHYSAISDNYVTDERGLCHKP